MTNILVHGLGQTEQSWDKVIEELNKSNIEVSNPNLFNLAKNYQINYENIYRTFADYCDSFKDKINLCGLSLGEYSALSAAGVFDPETAIQVVRERGLAMEKAAEGVESAMMAILGLEREPLLDICVGCDGYVSIANYNCPGQLVIAGEKKAVEEAGQKALDHGARRAVPLNTSGPFHTKLLKDASTRLHEVFKDVTFHEMNVPVIFNCTGKELEDCSVQEMLEKQVMSPVYFEDSIRTMINNGVDTIIEIGPGKVLSGFVRKIDRKIKTYQVEDMASLQKCVEALNETK